MSRPDDEIGLVLQVEGGYMRRWWRIMQPRPSAALALRTQIGSALGDAADYAVRLVLSIDAEAEAALEATQDQDEALALRTWRRMRSGGALVRQPDPEAESPADREPEDLRTASNRLWAVLRTVAKRTGVRLDGERLLGVPDPAPGGTHTWRRIGLGHMLLLSSDLSFGGSDLEPCFPPEDNALADAFHRATAEGNPAKFLEALDNLLISPDELALLITWAVLHLYRPF